MLVLPVRVRFLNYTYLSDIFYHPNKRIDNREKQKEEQDEEEKVEVVQVYLRLRDSGVSLRLKTEATQ